MTTRTQFRAICPACFREHAIEGAAMVQHGYTRPQGWHANIGTCYGYGRPHFGTPEGRDVAASCAAAERRYAAEQRRNAARILAGELDELVTDWDGRKIAAPTELDRRRNAQHCYASADTAEWSACQVEARVAAWQPAEPRAVAVEKRERPVHLARTDRNAHFVTWCTSSAMGGRRMYGARRVENLDEVTCERCRKRFEQYGARKVAA